MEMILIALFFLTFIAKDLVYWRIYKSLSKRLDNHDERIRIYWELLKDANHKDVYTGSDCDGNRTSTIKHDFKE